jgi:hypothetical protein
MCTTAFTGLRLPHVPPSVDVRFAGRHSAPGLGLVIAARPLNKGGDVSWFAYF